MLHFLKINARVVHLCILTCTPIHTKQTLLFIYLFFVNFLRFRRAYRPIFPQLRLAKWQTEAKIIKWLVVGFRSAIWTHLSRGRLTVIAYTREPSVRRHCRTLGTRSIRYISTRFHIAPFFGLRTV